MTDTLATSLDIVYDRLRQRPEHGLMGAVDVHRPGRVIADEPLRAEESRRGHDEGGLLSIGELAKRTGVSPRTIRYYEELGILPAPVRTKGGTRRYPREYVFYVEGALLLKDLGFTLEEIGDLDLWALEDDGAAAERAQALLRDKVALLEHHVHVLNRAHDLVETTRDPRSEPFELAPGLLRLLREEAAVPPTPPETGGCRSRAHEAVAGAGRGGRDGDG
ncbi:MerR family DNA-binding transcriptional regulator [Sphaerimonospora sp. CA-214678]|uniref:MerR family DNA-binding transcriptional regulator n=1 Tax=Sphaerimonospora sp. CA-214678 TaxID=3240029 RepID=UPI003D91BE24